MSIPYKREQPETPDAVALVPARSGSKRVTDKNVRPLLGHPVLAYTVSAALQSGVFSAVLVSTDTDRYADIARYYGAEVPFLRPEQLAGDTSPDIDWVDHALRYLRKSGRDYACFSILRPTSPFRLPETIRRAWGQFLSDPAVDSLRAVEKCKQHPGKMWILRGKRMTPLLPFSSDGHPWHSMQYPSLPEIYVQNASLEIAWSRVVFEGRTISGTVVTPFITEGFEGFDVNHPRDWELAEELVRCGHATLPAIGIPPFSQSGQS